MNKTVTCILCPNGCEMNVEFCEKKVISVNGNKCAKGAGYAEQEITAPVRNIASSVSVENGDMPLCSVRLSSPVPKERIFDVMNEIRKVKVKAPVCIGDVLISNVLGLKSDVIATRNVKKTD